MLKSIFINITNRSKMWSILNGLILIFGRNYQKIFAFKSLFKQNFILEQIIEIQWKIICYFFTKGSF